MHTELYTRRKQMSWLNGKNRKTIRIMAALILIAFGAELANAIGFPLNLLGAAIAGVGVVVFCSEVWTTMRSRRHDRYDLSSLKDAPTFSGASRDDPYERTLEPEWSAEDGDDILCRHCNLSVPASHSICPGCGRFLGT